MNINQKLIKLRKEKGLTQEQLSKKLGLSISTIRNYENKKRPRMPKNEILVMFAEFYNVSVEYLLNDEIENKSNGSINIEKELGLSEVSIEKISNIKNNNLQKDFNTFLSKIDVLSLCKYINNLSTLQCQWTSNISIFLQLYHFSDFLNENINKKPISKDLINFFDIFNKKMLEFLKFIESTEEISFFIDLETCNSLKKCLKDIENSFISGNVGRLNKKLIEFTNIAHDINNKVKYCIDFNKYHIQNLIFEFLINNFPDFIKDDITYCSDLKNYYKFINDGYKPSKDTIGE